MLTRCAVVAICLAVGIFSNTAPRAGEVEAGTLLNAGNIDSLLEQTLDGHRIGDLLIESVEENIRKYGLEIPLANYQPLELPPKYLAATQQNSGSVKLDPTTKAISGYVAGVPFPEITEADPDAGIKLLWNFFHAPLPYADVFEIKAETLLIDVNKGFERSLEIEGTTLYTQGRTSLQPVTIEPNILKRQLVVFTKPYDVAGLGQFINRYSDGTLDDAWIYVKSVRRTRRVSGGTWMDPMPNLDQLYDDYFTMDAHPLWYPEIKLIGRRHILATAHGIDPNIAHDVKDRVVLDSAPYGAPKAQSWEPRDVWVVEIVLPKNHPYGRKLVYMDTEATLSYFADT
ncbi:MAG: DUF1329 domain-containing protein, partial [Gammaproteobacteria bacterium]|nr:DUF1329 domain-containing protein [Gammaproteobacteria bacterium]